MKTSVLVFMVDEIGNAREVIIPKDEKEAMDEMIKIVLTNDNNEIMIQETPSFVVKKKKSEQIENETGEENNDKETTN